MLGCQRASFMNIVGPLDGILPGQRRSTLRNRGALLNICPLVTWRDRLQPVAGGAILTGQLSI